MNKTIAPFGAKLIIRGDDVVVGIIEVELKNLAIESNGIAAAQRDGH